MGRLPNLWSREVTTLRVVGLLSDLGGADVWDYNRG